MKEVDGEGLFVSSPRTEDEKLRAVGICGGGGR